MKNSKIKYIWILMTIGCLLYPPYHMKYKVGTSYDFRDIGYHWLLWPPTRGTINLSTLCIEIVICTIICFALYELCKKISPKTKSISPTPYLIPASPTVPKDWIIGGIKTGEPLDFSTVTSVLGNYLSKVKQNCGTIRNTKIFYDIYSFQFGKIHLQNNKIILIECFQSGITTPRKIVIGQSTVSDVLNAYGIYITRLVHNGNYITYVYSQESCDLCFTLNNKGIVIKISASISFC